MTAPTAPDEYSSVFRTEAHTVPVIRSARERAALQMLLLRSTAVEQSARGPRRRDAYRATRSLIAASRALGFTLSDLSAMLGVSPGSVRNRSSVITPVLPSAFLALVPHLKPVAAAAGVWDPEPLEETPVDPRELITWYLTTWSAFPPPELREQFDGLPRRSPESERDTP